MAVSGNTVTIISNSRKVFSLASPHSLTDGHWLALIILIVVQYSTDATYIYCSGQVLSLDCRLSLTDNALGFALGPTYSVQFISGSFSLQKYSFLFYPQPFLPFLIHVSLPVAGKPSLRLPLGSLCLFVAGDPPSTAGGWTHTVQRWPGQDVRFVSSASPLCSCTADWLLAFHLEISTTNN
jgi:hypothetical protein